ncbi:AAA family ATPase [Cellvibrio sp. PSBB006]|uniref:AAA family ATPase n=1 Tax=Cellvibrio sp. PSBB006 TaxID=1987723 RepID=UPI000B3B6D91|nr:AAA family ATPase [Cellvibrio sp. PSBB006]ARU27069.1 hypothetical protein CBR65_06230 [Cellvibrio sp. PSBB006]
MKIETLELENFKIFEEANIDFKKITLLAGANSAGKTTILNALASIIQHKNSTPFPFNYHNYGENVHLGGFKDIINNGDINKDLKLAIRFKHNDSSAFLSGKFSYCKKNCKIIAKEIILEFDSRKIELKKTENLYEIFKTVKKIDSSSLEEKVMKTMLSSISSALAEFDISKKNTNSSRKKVQDFEKEIEKSFQSSKEWQKISVKKDSDLLSTIDGNVIYTQEIANFKKSISNLDNHTTYIGPIRPYPSRHYFLQYANEKLDSLGSNSFQRLIDWANTEQSKFKKVISDLKFLKLADKLSTSTIKEELIELAVNPCDQTQNVNISDAGFGLSQILPILIANVAAKNGSTLLINQPEVHLHPSCQAQLANYFSKESQSKNFIIETHSEYLINRFRILVQRGDIKEEDISIVYIDRDKSGAKIHNIDILQSGSLRGAPKSFFETYYTDINELILGS